MERLIFIIIFLIMGLSILYAIKQSYYRQNSSEWITNSENEASYRIICWGLFACVITFLIPIIVSYF